MADFRIFSNHTLKNLKSSEVSKFSAICLFLSYDTCTHNASNKNLEVASYMRERWSGDKTSKDVAEDPTPNCFPAPNCFSLTLFTFPLPTAALRLYVREKKNTNFDCNATKSIFFDLVSCLRKRCPSRHPFVTW